MLAFTYADRAVWGCERCRLVCGVTLWLAIAVLIHPTQAPAQPARCNVTTGSQQAAVNPDGTFSIANVPASQSVLLSVVATCSQPDGSVLQGRSEFFSLGTGQTISVGAFDLTAVPRVPVALQMRADTGVLLGIGSRTSLTVEGVFAGGQSANLTTGRSGTTYTSSNDGIVQVGAAGTVIAKGLGTAIVSAINSGRTATIALRVVGADVSLTDSDTDGIPDSFEAANIENPGGADLTRLPGVTVAASSNFNNAFTAERAADGSLLTSWFTRTGDSANSGGSPFVEVRLPSPVNIAKVRIAGNREFADGRDFFAGIVTAFSAGDVELFTSEVIELPAPTRDVDVDAPVQHAIRVRFTATADESANPGLAEMVIVSGPGGRGLNPDDPGDAQADFDLDGLTNLEEFRLGTSVFNYDTDSDLISDGREVILGSSPLITDSDFDGLPDNLELDPAGDADGDGVANILDADADGDGLRDGIEKDLGLDPLDTDTDNDGISDGAEDSDGDGLSNLDEIGIGTLPGNPDSDDDGLTDGEEVLNGTDPLAPDVTPPTVELTTPAEGTTLIAGQRLVVRADATDDGRIPVTQFLIDGVVSNEDPFAPYIFAITVPPDATTWTVEAVATDTNDNSATTGAVVFDVVPDPLTTVEGVVVDVDGLPVAGAQVRLGDSLTTSAGNGTFAFSGVSTVDVPVVVFASLDTGLRVASGGSGPLVVSPGGVTVAGAITISTANAVSYSGMRIPLAGLPFAVRIGDLNSDGIPDFVTANGTGSGVTVMIAGASTQALYRDLNGGTVFDDVEIADLDFDGNPDVVAIGVRSSASIWLGSPTGELALVGSSQVNGRPSDLILADVNGDRTLDILTADDVGNGVSIALGKGDGTFRPSVLMPAGRAYSLVADDIDSDGDLDLLVTNSVPSGNTVRILTNDGTGVFAPAGRLPVVAAESIALLDVDRAGPRDIAVSRSYSTVVDIEIFTAVGDGSYSFSQSIPVGGHIAELVVADVDGDGIDDLLGADVDLGEVIVLLSRPEGGFEDLMVVRSGDVTRSLAVADLDGDGLVDLVTANAASNGDVRIHQGLGGGRFKEIDSLASGAGTAIARIVDLNNDTENDLVAANVTGDTVRAWFGFGGVLGGAVDTPVAGSPYAMLAVDLTGDFAPEVVTANLDSDTVTVLTNDGAGGLSLTSILATGQFPVAIAAGDLNGDLIPDLVTANGDGGTNDVSVFLGLSGTSFANGINIDTVRGRAHAIAIADIDADGVQDIVVADSLTDEVAILPGNNDGTFGLPISIMAGQWAHNIAIDDLDNDGNLDVIIASTGSDQIAILYGQAGFGFDPEVRFNAGRGAHWVAIVDINGDSIMDIVSANTGDSDVSVLIGDGNRGFALRYRFATAGGARTVSKGNSVTIGDVERDGVPELVVSNVDAGTVAILSQQIPVRAFPSYPLQ